MEPSGLGRRYCAFLLDIVFLEILGALVSWPLLDGVREDHDLAALFMAWFSRRDLDGEAVWILSGYLLLIGALWAWYFISFTALGGQTPGKKLLGIAVLKRNAQPAGYGTACLRFFAGYSATLMTLGLGFFWALLDRYGQALHDKIADTVVVRLTST